jgi:hypothetical protein
MKLFKYCDIDTATAILKDYRIRLNSASNFNDPYDSLGYKEIGGIVASREIFNEVYSQLPANIAGSYYLSDDELNQAYSNVKYISSSFLNLITCFSSCNDSILMWSHYAVKHCGVCLAFEIDESTKTNVRAIDYIDSNTLINNIRYPDALFIKHKDWAYEKEWRFIANQGMGATKEELLRGIDGAIKLKFQRKNISGWLACRDQLRAEYKRNRISYLENVNPIEIYLGTNYFNPQVYPDHILDLSDDVDDDPKFGTANIGKMKKVKRWRHADFLNSALLKKIPIFSMEMNKLYMRIDASPLNDQDTKERLENLNRIGYVSVGEIDSFGF